jgi:UTP--glucose-1-phosphate uridylyltransferase
MIKKAVIPVAGFGTRFLPASKAIPKEMFPVLDKPAIQYVVEESVASGIHDILMIISRGKRSVEEHFDRNPELERLLERKGQWAELDGIRHISNLANIEFVWQKEMNGLGDAVKLARNHIGDEPFALLLGDTIIQSSIPATRQLMDVHAKHGGCVIGLEAVPQDKVSRYGIIKGNRLGDGVYLLEGLVEKPAVDNAPSDLAIAGRYVLTAEIFQCLERVTPDQKGETQLTHALQILLGKIPMRGVLLEGYRHDIGNKLDFLKANLVFGLEHPELGRPLREFLHGLMAGADDWLGS